MMKRSTGKRLFAFLIAFVLTVGELGTGGICVYAAEISDTGSDIILSEEESNGEAALISGETEEEDNEVLSIDPEETEISDDELLTVDPEDIGVSDEAAGDDLIENETESAEPDTDICDPEPVQNEGTAGNGKALQAGYAVLGENVNRSVDGEGITAPLVYYGGYEWYVIGYDGTEVASKSNPGAATLFSKDNMGYSDFYYFTFHPNNNYCESMLERENEQIFGKFEMAEKFAINGRYLAKEDYKDTEPYCDGLSGIPIDSAMLWPLSTQEAYYTDSRIRKADRMWWLRSPGSEKNYIAVVTQNGQLIPYGTNSPIDTLNGIRSAFNLNLSSILFTSAAEDGKSAGSNGILNAVGNTTVNDWRVTLKDGSRSGFTASRVDSKSLIVKPGSKLKVKFSGAETGTDEYVSAVLVKEDAEDDILYYGHLANNATASPDAGVDVTLPEDLVNGEYILKVFSEKINTGKNADLASNPVDIHLIVKPFTVTVINGISALPAAKVGTSVEILAKGFDGQRFEKWAAISPTNLTFKNPSSTATSFIMPAHDVKIMARYKDIYPITVTNGSADMTTAAEGDTVKITADPAPEGKLFSKWVVNSPSGLTLADPGSETTTFTMPAKSVKVTAIYKDKQYKITVTDGSSTPANMAAAGSTVKLKANPAPEGKLFDKWVAEVPADLTITNATSSYAEFVMPAQLVKVRATYKTAYTVTVEDGTSDKARAGAGDTVVLWAGTPPAGQIFDKWEIVEPASMEASSIGLNLYASRAVFTMPSQNVKFKATYKEDMAIYTVTVIGGTSSAGENKVAAGETVTLDASTYWQKTFREWIVRKPASGLDLSDPYTASTQFTMPAEDVEVKATFFGDTNESHHVTLNAEPASGGSVSPNSGSYTEGWPFDITAIPNTGYYFKEWTLAGEGYIADPYSPETTFTPDYTDATLTAVFVEGEKVNNRVTFKANGHGTAPASVTVVKGNKITKPSPDPSETGYIFGGWYKEAACNNAWVFGTDTVTTDTTLYAKWTPISYTVTYDSNKPAEASASVSGTTADSMHEYGIAKNLSTVGYTLDGYIFMGWNTEADGSGTAYTDGQSVTNLASVDGTTVTLYAQWSKLHKLTGTAHPVAGGTVSPASDTGASGTEINISALESGGYKFKEWKLAGEGSIADPNSESTTFTFGDGDASVTAVFEEASLIGYTVTFDANGHGTAPASMTVPAGSKLTKPADPEEDGYVFGGWYREAECFFEWDFETDTVTEDTTLYVQWTKIDEFNVRFCDLAMDAYSGLYKNEADPAHIRYETVYTGSAVKPAVLVTGTNGIPLKEGRDYTIKYSNNKNVDKKGKPAKVTVKGKGNYKGKKVLKFYITRADLNILNSSDKLIIPAQYVKYNSAPAPEIYYGTYKLKASDLKYNKAKLKTDTNLDINGKGNFTGKLTGIQFKMYKKAEVSAATVKIKLTAGKHVYNGSAQTLTIATETEPGELKVTDGKGKILALASNFEVFYKNNKDAGNATVIVKGRGSYRGSASATFNIVPDTASPAEVTLAPGTIYFDPAGATPGLTVKVTRGGVPVELKEDRDYTVSYKNNKAVGTGKYTVSFKGNYKGREAMKRTFKIEKAAFAGASVTAPDMTFKKKGRYYSKVLVTMGKTLLKEKKDYTVGYYTDAACTTVLPAKYSLAGDSADIYVKVTGKGNYEAESVTASYKLYKLTATRKINLSKARIVDKNTGKKIKKQVYTGREIKPAVKVQVKEGKKWKDVDEANYDVTYYNNINKGKATILVNAKTDAASGSKTATFSIKTRSFGLFSWL